MANIHSYTITLSNNKSENEALSYLLTQDDRFRLIDKKMRKRIMNVLELDSSFARAFDLVYYEGAKKVEELDDNDIKDSIVLVELKTTKKKLPNNPQGFFFGATENEFNLARKIDKQYKFCFVSLHEGSPSYRLLDIHELEKLIKTKRIQYQINL